MATDINGSVSFYTSPNPAIRGAYVFSIGGVAGVVAAQNHLSLFNPSGSGRNISLGAAYVHSEATAASLTPAPMQGFRITAASGGTLQTNSTAVAQFQTSMPTSIAEVRTGNPTVTTAAQIFNASPVISPNTGASTPQYIAAAPAVYPPFILAPGEGIVLRTSSGLTTMSWNLSVVWAEL